MEKYHLTYKIDKENLRLLGEEFFKKNKKMVILLLIIKNFL